jgi:hypothetical protein
MDRIQLLKPERAAHWVYQIGLQCLPRPAVVVAVAGIVRHLKVVDHDDGVNIPPEYYFELLGEREICTPMRIKIGKQPAILPVVSFGAAAR